MKIHDLAGPFHLIVNVFEEAVYNEALKGPISKKKMTDRACYLADSLVMKNVMIYDDDRKEYRLNIQDVWRD